MKSSSAADKRHHLSHRAHARWLVAGAVLLVMLSVLSSLVETASAQANETPPQGAVEHYNRGRAHYQAGRYREALRELERALTMDPRSPNLVYNVARVHELLGELEEAIQFYRRYRDMLPMAERDERERIQAIVLRLLGALKHATPNQPAVEERLREPSARPVRMERGVADGAFWTTAVMGASALAASAVTGGLALKTERDVEGFVVGADGPNDEREKLAKKADRLALSSDVTFIIGTTFAVTSILLYMLRERPVSDEDRAYQEEDAGLRLGASPTGVVLTFGASL